MLAWVLQGPDCRQRKGHKMLHYWWVRLQVVRRLFQYQRRSFHLPEVQTGSIPLLTWYWCCDSPQRPCFNINAWFQPRFRDNHAQKHTVQVQYCYCFPLSVSHNDSTSNYRLPLLHPQQNPISPSFQIHQISFSFCSQSFRLHSSTKVTFWSSAGMNCRLKWHEWFVFTCQWELWPGHLWPV